MTIQDPRFHHFYLGPLGKYNPMASHPPLPLFLLALKQVLRQEETPLRQLSTCVPLRDAVALKSGLRKFTKLTQEERGDHTAATYEVVYQTTLNREFDFTLRKTAHFLLSDRTPPFPDLNTVMATGHPLDTWLVSTHEPSALALNPALYNPEFVIDLLEIGCNPNSPNLPISPFFGAVAAGHLEAVASLLQHGANLEATDQEDQTPLHWATRRENTEIATLLVDAEANLEATDNEGKTPLHLAAINGYTQIAQVLVDAEAILEPTDNHARTPLHWAAQWGRTQTTQVLVDAEAILEATDKLGNTPLHWAVRRGHTQTAQVLVDAGAILEATDNDASTPLHLAVQWGRTETTQFLVDAGAILEATDNEGNTPLHLAQREDKREIAALLLSAGETRRALVGLTLE